MKLSVTLFIVILLGTIACRPSKSGGQLYADEKAADSVFNHYSSRKQYDSALFTAINYMNGRLAGNLPVPVTEFAYKIYDSLAAAPGHQLKLAEFLFSNRQLIEKDTAAIEKMYKIFSGKYVYGAFLEKYDQQYVQTGEYCLSLQQKHSNLSAATLLDFTERLGIIYNILGDLKKAAAYYEKVYKYDLSQGDGYYIAGSAGNLGIYWNESNQPDSTIRICGDAMPLKNVPPKRKVNLLINIAEAWSQKSQIQKSLQLLNEARKIATDTSQLKNPAEQLADIYRTLSQAHLRAGNCTVSLNAALQALPWGISHHHTYRHRVIGKILQQIGQNHLRLGQPDSALWYYHQSLYTVARTDSANVRSLPALKDIYAENTLMDALDGMANAWDAKYKTKADPDFLQQALLCRQLAFETERKLLETFTYDESMTLLLRESKNRSRKALVNCYALWAATRQPQWVEQALQVAEKSKAVALLHSVQRNRALAGNNAADSLLAKVQQLRYQELALQRELSQTAGAVKDSLLKYQQDINDKYLAADAELKRQHPELKRSGLDATAITLKKLRSALLRPGAFLLEFFEADSTTCVIWLGDNGQSGMYMPGADIQHEIKEYAASLVTSEAFNRDSAAFFKTALQCTRLLPPYLIEALQSGACTRLIVIPDGRISQLPVDALALPLPGGPPRFLIEYATVQTGYSLSTLLTNLETGQTFNTGSPAVFSPFSKTGRPGLPRLAKTFEEAGAVQRQLNGGYWYNDSAARKPQFWKSLKEASILHIASHAIAGDSLPPRIYLYADSVSMPELYATGARARLVVLSACQTGVGEIDMNEGPLSLSRAFYYAGAGGVINSLWRVDDIANARIFEYFYKEFPGSDAATALRRAKLRYLKEADPSRRAPFYWAGMTHTGLENMEMNSKTKKYWWAAVMAALAAIAGLVYYKRRNRRNRP